MLLDVIGPYEGLSRLPGAEVRFVASEVGSLRTDNSALGLTAGHALRDVPSPEIVLVPGGPGTRDLVEDEGLLEWLRAAHRDSRWTTSMCTGALVLGAAGILEGLRATTHWRALDQLAAYGARLTRERIVEEGKVITGAGVSAGIDMALRLAQRESGDQLAQAIQLIIEYDPQPPFDAGSAARAPDEVIALATELFQSRPDPRPAQRCANPPRGYSSLELADSSAPLLTSGRNTAEGSSGSEPAG